MSYEASLQYYKTYTSERVSKENIESEKVGDVF